jgi:phosphatidate phosphatase APP1
MKSSKWLCLLLALSFSKANALTVVSDIDDTIKIMHVNAIPSLILHVPLLTAFSGMSTVYRELLQSGGAETYYYLSGSPVILTHHLDRFIARNDFPKGVMLLRHRSVDPKEVGAYKIQALRKLMTEISDTVLLIGDDTERDADVFAQISREYPSRVDSIYIHRVRGVPLSSEAVAAGATTFLTALDLAEELYSKGKLPEAGLKATALSILAERHEHRIVAPFQHCPEFGPATPITGNAELDALVNETQNRVQEICAD